jgi:uncharacterized protein YqhQ
MTHSIGGQAVIEGVMMRSQKHLAVAVRLENGKIKIKKQKLKKVLFSKIFFLRGITNLIDTLKLGIKTLNWSAEQQMDEDEKESSGIITVLGTIFAVVMALGLFKFLPLFITKAINPTNPFVFNFYDGFIKIIVFIGYLLVISRFSEVKRVFQYHGAEHQVIGCFEAKKKLTPKNCRKYHKEHKRCGTNFLFLVIFISIFIYFLIPIKFNFFLNLLLRILFLPFIAGISYELIKLTGKYDNWLTSLISMPGLLMQRLTTFKPDTKQLEVAIASLQTVFKAEKIKY